LVCSSPAGSTITDIGYPVYYDRETCETTAYNSANEVFTFSQEGRCSERAVYIIFDGEAYLLNSDISVDYSDPINPFIWVIDGLNNCAPADNSSIIFNSNTVLIGSLVFGADPDWSYSFESFETFSVFRINSANGNFVCNGSISLPDAIFEDSFE